MAPRHLLATFACLLAVLFFGVSSCHANGIRGSSMYGDGTTFATCLASTTNCEAFNTATFSANGQTILQFVFNTGTGPSTILDVVDLGPITAGGTFTLASQYFGAGTTEVFACGSASDPTGGSGVVESSTGALPAPGFSGGGPCTTLTSTTDSNFALSGSTSTTLSFLTDSGFNVNGDLVVDSTVPTATAPVPEPSTLMLVGVGLLAVGRKLRPSSKDKISD